MRSSTNTSSNRATFSGGYASFYSDVQRRRSVLRSPGVEQRRICWMGRTQGDYNDWDMNTPAFERYYRS